jgi:MFS family permease
LADRFGRRAALWLALAALHIGQFSSALAPNKWAYLVARHFAGIGVVRKDIKSGDPPPCFLGGGLVVPVSDDAMIHIDLPRQARDEQTTRTTHEKFLKQL